MELGTTFTQIRVTPGQVKLGDAIEFQIRKGWSNSQPLDGKYDVTMYVEKIESIESESYDLESESYDLVTLKPVE